MSERHIKLKKFDIKLLKDNSTIVMLGKRNTGKSFLMRHILYYHRDIPLGNVISPTEQANPFFSDFVPHILIHDEFDSRITDNFKKRQIRATKMSRKDKRYDPRAFLILDDCMYDKTCFNDESMRYFFMNGRHVKTLLMITMQYPLGIPPSLRSNVDFVFILRENILSNRKRIYQNWAGMFPSFSTFCKTMDQCTENYECLVIDNSSKSNYLEDVVYWYKATPHEKFRTCCPTIWQISEKSKLEEEKKKNKPQRYEKKYGKESDGIVIKKLSNPSKKIKHKYKNIKNFY